MRKCRLAVNQLAENHFLRLLANVVHASDPRHLVAGFQFLRHALLLRELLRQTLEPAHCFLLDLIQMLRQFARRQEIDEGHSPVLLQKLPPQVSEFAKRNFGLRR